MPGASPLKIALVTSLIVATLVSGCAVMGLSDFELSTRNTSEHKIIFGNDIVSGTLALPEKCDNPKVAIVVHGDGAQDRWSNDTYLPLINSLLKNCIGVYSWDKPGVGNSTGNWLHYTMAARAELATQTLQYLKTLAMLSPDQIGYLGFSQAGWVVPKATTLQRPAFSLLIGPAINWQAQSAYLTRTRLALEGVPPQEAARVVQQIQKQNEELYASIHSNTTIPDYMDPDRFQFICMNYMADAEADLTVMQGPVMAMWGANDLNVDAMKNAARYKQLLTLHSNTQVTVTPKATHSLLRARWFNYQNPDQWSGFSKVLFIGLGRNAYTPGVVDTIAHWINKSIEKTDPLQAAY